MNTTEKPTPQGFRGLEDRQNATQRLSDLVKIFEELKGNRKDQLL